MMMVFGFACNLHATYKQSAKIEIFGLTNDEEALRTMMCMRRGLPFRITYLLIYLIISLFSDKFILV